MNDFFEKILNVFFPPKCIFCDGIMPASTIFCVCDECKNAMPELADRQCEVCGGEIDAVHGDFICQHCKTEQTFYLANVPTFKYDGKVKNAVLRLKFSYCVDYAKTMATLMTAQLLNRFSANDFDVVVPVPIGPKRLKKRRYNQSELLAKYVAENLNLSMDKSSLLRKDAMPQSKLSQEARLKNLKDVFYLQGNNLENKRVLLVDDVYTTGATINTASKILMKKAKAKEVYGLTFAKT